MSNANGMIEDWPGEVPAELCMEDARQVEGYECFCEVECERAVRGYEVKERE